MEEKKQKIILAAIIVLLVVLVGFIAWQQKTINSLKQIVLDSGSPSTVVSDMEIARQPDDLVERLRNSLITNTREIRGKVVEVKSGTITVEADLVELEKLPNAESLDPEMLPRAKKNIAFRTNEKTEFLSAKLSDIKPSIQIQVFTDENIYGSDHILATKVNYPYIAEGIAGQKFVSGIIKEIKGEVLILSGLSREGKETDAYTIKITGDTKFIKKEQVDKEFKESEMNSGDLKTGNNVLVRAANPIGDRKEFDAVAIEILVASKAE